MCYICASRLPKRQGLLWSDQNERLEAPKSVAASLAYFLTSSAAETGEKSSAETSLGSSAARVKRSEEHDCSHL